MVTSLGFKDLQHFIIAIILCSTLAISLANNVHALNHVALKHSASVSDQNVMLSDIFSGISQNSDHIALSSPKPGQSVTLGSRELRFIANKAKLDWKPTHGRQFIKIYRKGRRVPTRVIKESIEKALIKEHSESEIEVNIVKSQIDLFVSENEDTSIQIHDLIYDNRSQRFSALVSAPQHSSSTSPISVKGQIYALVSMPVLNRHIRPGEIIKFKDLTWRKFRANQSTYNTIGSFDDLIEKIAQRPLVAGRLIRFSDVRPLQLVKRGDFVTVHLRNSLMSLTTRGISIESGARNEIIRIRNPRSKKVIEAKVIGPNIASVNLSRVASNN